MASWAVIVFAHWRAALALCLALLAVPASLAATLIAKYDFDELSYPGAAGELKDSAGYSGGPFNGSTRGTPLPTPANNAPARSGTAGTCGYANLPGPANNGGGFVINNLPVVTTAGAKTSVSFWMYWNGVNTVMPIGWRTHDLYLQGVGFGFNTGNGDVYGIPNAGLANTWKHVVAVFTNGSVVNNKLYIDGVDVGALSYQVNTSSTLGSAVVNSSLHIGGWGNSGTAYRFGGRIDQVRVFNGELRPEEVTRLYNETATCTVATPHHLRISHASGTGLTCTPSTVTLTACANADCSEAFTGGVTGTLGNTGGSVAWPAGTGFSMPAGSNSTTVSLQSTTTTAALLRVASSNPYASNPTVCNFGSPTCSFTAADSGLLLSVPDHVSETSQAISVSAVKKADNSLACTPAFANVSRSINFSCSYSNPGSGTRTVRVAGTAVNAAGNANIACDASGRSLSLAFNASGTASTTLQYADVGQLALTGRYTGSAGTSDTGLVMSGSASFIAAPASFAFSGVTAGTIRAGNAFSATVTARNNSGATTTNFGRESPAEAVQLGFSRYQPTGAGASDGSFSGSLGAFSSGAASASNLAWTEVGSIDLRATLASGSYLGSGISASGTTGSTGAVGRFIPHHFDLDVAAACGAFSYAGQPFAVVLRARNAANATTVNYDGSSSTSPNFARATTLSDASALGVGTLSGNTVAASAFRAGVGNASPAYSYTSKTTTQRSLVLRATDTDATSSNGFDEPPMLLRSGRLRLSNAFGKTGASLQVPVVAEYWAGNTWQLNTGDNCSSLAAASVVLSNPRQANGAATAASTSAGALALSAGSGSITLTAPSPAGSSLSLDLALNLGSTASDLSCNSSRPASTGAGLPWLRAQNGSCAASADRDPAGRASFGIFTPETRKTVHVRDMF